MVAYHSIIVWNNHARDNFRKAINRIQKEFPRNAESVKYTVAALIDELIDFPEKYPLDKYKINNKGNHRAFEKYRFRITYRYSAKEIRIIRFRSTDQKPRNF